MEILPAPVTVVAATVFPVIPAACPVGAGTTTFGPARSAVFAQLVLSALLQEVATSRYFALAFALVAGSAILGPGPGHHPCWGAS